MDRRAFLGTLAGGLLAVPLAVDAGLPRVGHLTIAGPNSTPQPPPENWDAFLAALREGGCEEGKTFTFEHWDAASWPAVSPPGCPSSARRSSSSHLPQNRQGLGLTLPPSLLQRADQVIE